MKLTKTMNDKIFYAIKTTKKYQKRIDSILDTWLTGIEDYIFFSDHEDLDNNVILSSLDSSYEGTLEKFLYFFNNVGSIFYKDSQESVLDYYDWIFVCDDDTFVNTKMLEKFVIGCDSEKAYCETITPQKNSDNYIWKEYSHIFKENDIYFSGGAGILISSKSLKKINEFKDIGIRFDDAAVGVTIHRNGIELFDSPFFHSQPPEFWGHTDRDVIDNITYHHINEDRMYKLFEYLK